MNSPITVTLSRQQYDTIEAALSLVAEDYPDDARIQEEIESCLRLLAEARVLAHAG